MDQRGPPPVVNMKRHMRIHPPEKPVFEWNMMNMCVILIALTFVGLWMRAVDIRKARNISTRRDADPVPSALPGSS